MSLAWSFPTLRTSPSIICLSPSSSSSRPPNETWAWGVERCVIDLAAHLDIRSFVRRTLDGESRQGNAYERDAFEFRIVSPRSSSRDRSLVATRDDERAIHAPEGAIHAARRRSPPSSRTSSNVTPQVFYMTLVTRRIVRVALDAIYARECRERERGKERSPRDARSQYAPARLTSSVSPCVHFRVTSSELTRSDWPRWPW